jgi:hypothetical protein
LFGTTELPVQDSLSEVSLLGKIRPIVRGAGKFPTMAIRLACIEGLT